MGNLPPGMGAPPGGPPGAKKEDDKKKDAMKKRCAGEAHGVAAACGL